jgi:hypothetical protein
MELDTLLKLAALAMSVASFAYAWTSARSKATAEKVEAIDQRVIAVTGRVTKLESDIEHLPDKDTLHRLEIAIAEMSGEMRVLAEKINPVSAISERLQDYLLERGK